MATTTFPRLAGARSRITDSLPDFGARIGVGGLFLVLAWQLGGDFVRTGRPTDLLLLVGESLVVILTCFRRRAHVVDTENRDHVVHGGTASGAALCRRRRYF